MNTNANSNSKRHALLGLSLTISLAGVAGTLRAEDIGCPDEPAWLAAAAAYESADQSPWAAADGWQYFWLEDFEDGATNTPGLSIYSQDGYVRAPSDFTDSVDGDDGLIDGSGAEGHSYHAELIEEPGSVLALIVFDEEELGQFPNRAGFVWTDGLEGAILEVTAFDADGEVAANIEFVFGNDVYEGSTAEDRFIGLTYAEGIRSMILKTSEGGLEIDHVQYGNIPECAADTNGDRVVDVFDLLTLLSEWGDDNPCSDANVNGEGGVDFMDLLELMAAWGSCF